MFCKNLRILHLENIPWMYPYFPNCGYSSYWEGTPKLKEQTNDCLTGGLGGPRKIHPNLEPGWVGFGLTFPARNELICTSFETDELDENVFQKRCAFVLLPNMLWYLLCFLSYSTCFVSTRAHRKFHPSVADERTKGAFELRTARVNRGFVAHIQHPAVPIQRLWYPHLRFFTSGYHLHAAASDFNLPPFWVARVANACNSSRVP